MPVYVDISRCIGCRSCEVICSAFHATPKYSSINPARSRIQVSRHALQDLWVPVLAGELTYAKRYGSGPTERSAPSVSGHE